MTKYLYVSAAAIALLVAPLPAYADSLPSLPQVTVPTAPVYTPPPRPVVAAPPKQMSASAFFALAKRR